MVLSKIGDQTHILLHWQADSLPLSHQGSPSLRHFKSLNLPVLSLSFSLLYIKVDELMNLQNWWIYVFQTISQLRKEAARVPVTAPLTLLVTSQPSLTYSAGAVDTVLTRQYWFSRRERSWPASCWTAAGRKQEERACDGTKGCPKPSHGLNVCVPAKRTC